MSGVLGLLPQVEPPPRPPFGRSRLGVASIETWPAAGGGLLVGMAESNFAGAAPLRPPVKTVFLQLNSSGAITLLLPYVLLEQEARHCLRVLVAGELGVDLDAVVVSDGQTDGPFRIVDIAPRAERNLQACAAAARELLLAVAAEGWSVPVSGCRVSEGVVMGPTQDQQRLCEELVVDAALAEMPAFVRLRSGRLVCVRPVPRSRRYHRPNAKDRGRQQDNGYKVLSTAPTL